MITIRTTDAEPLIIDSRITSPSVYLDYCVIAELANDFARGARFREILLRRQGTLLFSWAHLLEVFGLGYGPTYNRIKSFLDGLGTSFVLIENDPGTVIQRETESMPQHHPVLDTDLLRHLGATWDALTPLTLGVLLEGLGEDPALQRKLQEMHARHKVNMKQMVDDARRNYREDKGVRKRLDAAAPSHSRNASRTAQIFEMLLRECVRTNEVFSESDSLDFEHAVVSSSYSTYVVLDQKWARRVRKIDLPKGAAIAFDVKQLEEFLAELHDFVTGSST
jgi:hypothetical protein